MSINKQIKYNYGYSLKDIYRVAKNWSWLNSDNLWLANFLNEI